jgi:hypothetical protein
MATMMSPLLWIAFGFVALLVVVLIITLWFPPKSNKNSPQVLRFLMALCAAFAGGFFTGNALVSGQYTSGALTFSVSGAAGFAAFLVVWYGYRIVESLFPGMSEKDEPGSLDIAPNFTFRYAAQIVAQTQGCGVTFDGFTKEELHARLRVQHLEAKSWTDLLLALRAVTADQEVRRYTVTKEGSSFNLKIEGTP